MPAAATQDASTPPKTPFPPCRYIIVAMGFFAIINSYTLRVTLNVAIVDMVNGTWMREQDALKAAEAANISLYSNSTGKTGGLSSDCGTVADGKNKTYASDGPFEWDASLQYLITGAFYYGYITTQMVGGLLSQRFGGKYVLLIGLGVASLLTLLTPVVTYAGDWQAILALRIAEGAFEGVGFPAMNAILSNWAPALERTTMSSFVFAGAQIGTLIGMGLTGVLGWENAFYFFGGLGLVWSLLWFFLVFNSPAVHPRISTVERQYIESSLPKRSGSHSIPWCKLATSMPVYALCIAQFTTLWGYYTLLNTLPQYFKNILKFDIAQNGALSGAPYLVMWVMMMLIGFFSDVLRHRKILTTTNVRKLVFVYGFTVPSICLIAVGFVDCHNAVIAVVLIIIAIGSIGASYVTMNVNHLDLAPPFAGTLMGIANTLGTVPGFVGTYVVSAFTSGNQTVEAWRNVFYVTAGIHTFGTLFYLIFGSGELQPWAKHVQPGDEGDAADPEQKKALAAGEDVKLEKM